MPSRLMVTGFSCSGKTASHEELLKGSAGISMSSVGVAVPRSRILDLALRAFLIVARICDPEVGSNQKALKLWGQSRNMGPQQLPRTPAPHLTSLPYT